MSQPTNIEYNGIQAKVTPNGELVVSSVAYSEPYYVELGVDLQIYNCVPLVAKHRFVIVGMLIGADRNVTTDCTVNVYESETINGTSSREILTIDLNKGEHTYLNLIHLTTEPNRFVNATTDDDDVDLTIFGYYALA